MKIDCHTLMMIAMLMAGGLLGSERAGLAKEVEKHRNDVEENWNRQYKSYNYTESENIQREATRVNVEEREPAAQAGWQKSEKSRPSYASP